MTYLVRWRHDWPHPDGRSRRLVREMEVSDGEQVRRLVGDRALEAIGGEFAVLAGERRQDGWVHVHAVEVAGWSPCRDALPRSVMETRWKAEETAETDRLRVLALVGSALAEASRLGLGRRRGLRRVLDHLRGVLADAPAT